MFITKMRLSVVLEGRFTGCNSLDSKLIEQMEVLEVRFGYSDGELSCM